MTLPWLSANTCTSTCRPEFDVFLDVDGRVLERVLRLGPGGLEAGAERDVVVGDAHPAPTPAGGGLDDDGIPDLGGDLQRGLLVIDRAFAAGDGGDLRLLRQLLAFDLVPDGRHRG